MAKLCAVVKSDAYGHGMERVANALYPVCDWFAVSNVAEGLRLRTIGIDKPVLVMVPYLQDVQRAVSLGLTLAVQDCAQLQAVHLASEQTGRKASVHLVFNSGMNRFGADLKDIARILDFAKNKRVIIDGLFSHYACPDEQLERERAKNKFLLANKLIKDYNSNATCHISASGGFLVGDYFDMVRIGILLYGYKPFDYPDFKVQPAMSVYAPVISRRSLSKNDGCLYGLTRPNRSADVSIVGYGYADGLPRRPSTNQLGNKCMEASAFFGVGGEYYPVMTNAQSVAEQYGTISYEVLTKCALRAEKIYY